MTPTREQIQDVLQAMAICPWGTKSYRDDVFEINRTIRAVLVSALTPPEPEAQAALDWFEKFLDENRNLFGDRYTVGCHHYRQKQTIRAALLRPSREKKLREALEKARSELKFSAAELDKHSEPKTFSDGTYLDSDECKQRDHNLATIKIIDQALLETE